MLLEPILEEAARRSRRTPRLSVTGSSITIVHALPSSVSDAATSQPMYEPPIRTTRLPAASSRIVSLLPSVRR